ncbi:hypothetical protein [Chryseobacterium sp. 18068]|uniref:hypothetical protein n=1 Tax=Chryseobacterium sp. 18068 TaxID=2681414 RepID=UPI001359726C|nr:hypothetical protein [Chryseobacterium sp. 18068]
MAINLFKFLLMDDESLNCYKYNKNVSFEDLKRRLFLIYRAENPTIPDHILRLHQNKTFDGITTISEIFLKGILGLSKEYLELDDNRIYVKQEMQILWQELLTYIPPLFLQAVLLQDLYKAKSIDTDDKKFYELYILPNSRYTAIPSAKITNLDFFVNENNGLHDLHMHLNGSMETDHVWQDFLKNQILLYRDLKSSFHNSKVKEQLEQESSLLEPISFIKFLQEAKRIRKIFYIYVFHEHQLSTINVDSDLGSLYKHPFLGKVSDRDDYPHIMSVELYMYVLVLDKLRRSPQQEIAKLLHHYLLILGLTNRLLVQQTHQNGFEQFQKNTLNGLRESSEISFKRRFFQMHGNDLRFLKFLEGRFSPKTDQIELKNQLDNITKGWNYMLSNAYKKEESNNLPEISLIAHFIKKKDSNRNYYIRHKKLRIEIINKGRNLNSLLSKFPEYKKIVNGIDAASSEFDAPPEVFSPLYRLMRRKGFNHFTYHAGEDFYHIIDGLRAIYEAIKFCDLQKTDRIGHATAAGIDVDQWANVVGNEILISQGCQLDNLIFIYHFIVFSQSKKLSKALPAVISEINNLSYSIYNDYYPPTVLEQAWLMRASCPLHLFSNYNNNLRIQGVYDDSELDWIVKKGFLESLENKESSKAYQLFKKYHSADYRKNYDKIICISPFNILTPKQVKTLQLTLLEFMATNEIIIESLPTSNIRIGFHKDFSTYHLKNWIKWSMEGHKIPPIVLGSDDTGIFATNIYNEYANVFCALMTEEFLGLDEGMDVLKNINKNSLLYKFS